MPTEDDQERNQSIVCNHCGLPIYDTVPLHTLSEVGRECYHEDCAARVGILVKAYWDNQ